MSPEKIGVTVAAFNKMPDESGVPVAIAGIVLHRSLSSIWRDLRDGRLRSFSLGRSRRVVVGSIRSVVRGAK